jgi:1,4-alpha-glucan branching enzyme
LSFGLKITTLNFLPESLVLIRTIVKAIIMKKEIIIFITFVLVSFLANAAVLPLPAGIRDGINYNSDNVSVTLVLHAPGKTKVVVIGDFNSWIKSTSYEMNKTPDGQKFWITISSLTTGLEYAFQYVVDDVIKIADPYSEKILDASNDPYINDVSGFTVYPNLKAYPSGKTTGYVSVIQTGKAVFNWTNTTYAKPAQNKLLVYEMLVRDFVATHSWKTLKDTLNYLQNLGINAIELMPFNEFDGNNSWGYNPNFYNAPDKYYGTDSDLKAFIDECHKRNIAVIQDIVFNHAWGSSPLAQLYYDATNNRPAANNPWFNQTAPHPFGFGCDFNFNSTATKYYFQRILEYWLTEYKIDGFRFDLSKGFTNKNTGSDVAAWGAYDAERVANIKWLADIVWNKVPTGYVILEHLGDWGEENEFMNYKQGMMPWHRLDTKFNEATMGWSGCKQDISEVYYKYNNNFSRPLRMGNIESHDEERLMYKNLTYGNTTTGYNAKNLTTALSRMQAAAAFDLLIPGPKMLWQFIELGYDYSINTCTNGSLSDQCRTSKKPIRWDYFQNTDRRKLYNVMSALMKLKNKYSDVFATDLLAGYDLGCNTFKFYQVSNSPINVTVLGNFDVVAKTKTINFQKTGTWTNYITGATYNYTTTSQSITLQPGEFRVVLDKNITAANIDMVKNFSVYFKKPTNWASAKIHSWNSVPTGSAPESIWPGSNMIQVCGDWYRWDFTNISSINLVFDDGGSNKTVDLFANGTAYYDNGWLSTVPTICPAGITAYFENTGGWAQPKVYCWSPTPSFSCPAWPGTNMTKVANCGDWWSYFFSGVTATNLIFNSGTGTQTADLYLGSAGSYKYSWATKAWTTGGVSCSARPAASANMGKDNRVSVVPNPVRSNMVQLQIEAVFKGSGNIKIINSHGATIRSLEKINISAGKNNIGISFLKLAPGCYTALLQLNNDVIPVKFIVN